MTTTVNRVFILGAGFSAAAGVRPKRYNHFEIPRFCELASWETTETGWKSAGIALESHGL